jgi:hypothetical protein
MDATHEVRSGCNRAPNQFIYHPVRTAESAEECVSHGTSWSLGAIVRGSLPDCLRPRSTSSPAAFTRGRRWLCPERKLGCVQTSCRDRNLHAGGRCGGTSGRMPGRRPGSWNRPESVTLGGAGTGIRSRRPVGLHPCDGFNSGLWGDGRTPGIGCCACRKSVSVTLTGVTERKHATIATVTPGLCTGLLFKGRRGVSGADLLVFGGTRFGASLARAFESKWCVGVRRFKSSLPVFGLAGRCPAQIVAADLYGRNIRGIHDSGGSGGVLQ